MISTRFHLRTYRRFPVCCPFYYQGDGFVGQGMLWNLSAGGWRASGDHPVFPGMTIALRLFLPDQIRPVEVDRATVQWLKGQEFGLQIGTIQPEEVVRLNQFVTSLVNRFTLSGLSAFSATNGQDP